jgi:3D (Asp-Asp-Asp) domain-containing protein
MDIMEQGNLKTMQTTIYKYILDSLTCNTKTRTNTKRNTSETQAVDMKLFKSIEGKTIRG